MGRQTEYHNHREEEGADVEYALRADRLPKLFERIEVDMVDRQVVLALVPRKEWAPCLPKKLPGRDSNSYCG